MSTLIPSRCLTSLRRGERILIHLVLGLFEVVLSCRGRKLDVDGRRLGHLRLLQSRERFLPGVASTTDEAGILCLQTKVGWLVQLGHRLGEDARGDGRAMGGASPLKVGATQGGVRDGEVIETLNLLVETGILGSLHRRVTLVDSIKAVGAHQVRRRCGGRDVRVFGRGSPVASKLRLAPFIQLVRQESGLGTEGGMSRVTSARGRRGEVVLVEGRRLVCGGSLVGVRVEEVGRCRRVVALRHSHVVHVTWVEALVEDTGGELLVVLAGVGKQGEVAGGEVGVEKAGLVLVRKGSSGLVVSLLVGLLAVEEVVCVIKAGEVGGGGSVEGLSCRLIQAETETN